MFVFCLTILMCEVKYIWEFYHGIVYLVSEGLHIRIIMYHIFQVLELTGYNVSQGADFKLFAVMAALSLRISALE